jgi:cytochrome P450
MMGDIAPREAGPVSRVVLPDGVQAWLVTGYDDVRQALADPRLSRSSAEAISTLSTLPPAVLSAVRKNMLRSDPPDHTRLRRLVAAGFTTRRVEALRPRVEEIAGDLLDAMAGRGEVDLIEAYGSPLPIQVICELLGVPAGDRAEFREWTAVIVGGVTRRPELPAAMGAMVTYLAALIAAKRADPGDDLISALVAISLDGDRLGDDELSSMVYLLLVAGFETTANLIANGVHLLLSERDRWERLRSDPAAVPAAVEEILRLEGPVATSAYRRATAALELGGERIEAGETVVVSLRSANLDATHYGRPEAYDPERPEGGHLAFGHGIHHCLGAPLARLEGQVALTALLRRFPRLRLADSGQPDRRPGILVHALTRLPITGL